MGLISWIVVGAIAGFLADKVMDTRAGLVTLVLLGMVGAIVGGFVATLLFKNVGVSGFNIESVVVAAVGAIAVAFVLGGKARTHGLFGR